MYIASNLVRNSEGVEGVNAFLHIHEEQGVPRLASGVPNVDLVTTLEGGYLVASRTDLKPGGNDVRAHLDIVADDDATEQALDTAVIAVRALIGDRSRGVDAVELGVAARFGAVIAYDGQPDALREVLDRLWRSGRALLEQRGAPPVLTRGPYVAWAEAMPNGVRLRLPPATLARLPRSAPRNSIAFAPGSVLAAFGVKDGLIEMARSLLGLDASALAREGGFEVIDPRSGTVLASELVPPPARR